MERSLWSSFLLTVPTTAVQGGYDIFSGLSGETTNARSGHSPFTMTPKGIMWKVTALGQNYNNGDTSSVVNRSKLSLKLEDLSVVWENPSAIFVESEDIRVGPATELSELMKRYGWREIPLNGVPNLSSGKATILNFQPPAISVAAQYLFTTIIRGEVV